MSPLQAIKAKCLDCCCDSRPEVQLCPCTDCPLHIFRFGRLPKEHNKNRTKRVLTEEQRAAAIERLAKAREARKAQQKNN